MKDKIVGILKDYELLRTDGVHKVMIKGVFPELYEKIATQIDSLYRAEQRERYEKAADYFDKTFEQKIRWPYDRMCEIASGIDKQKEER